MKQKDNRSTGALVVSLTFAVVVFTALYIQHQSAIEPVAVVETPVFLEDMNFSESEMVEETVTSETDVLEEQIATPEPPGVISFAKAYALSPGKPWVPARRSPGTACNIPPTQRRKQQLKL